MLTCSWVTFQGSSCWGTKALDLVDVYGAFIKRFSWTGYKLSIENEWASLKFIVSLHNYTDTLLNIRMNVWSILLPINPMISVRLSDLRQKKFNGDWLTLINIWSLAIGWMIRPRTVQLDLFIQFSVTPKSLQKLWSCFISWNERSAMGEELFFRPLVINDCSWRMSNNYL